MIRVFFVGDVVGRPGREFLCRRAASLRAELGLTFLVANGENSAAGSGITGSLARQMLESGVDAITLGDHVWDQKGFETEIVGFERVGRPANLPVVSPGRPWVVVERDGVRLAVFTVLGRHFMPPRDCPFLAADRVLSEIDTAADFVLVEIHAEATSEKIALGRYLDGRVAAVVGTHTHVPTADAAVLPGGTAYITDVGMTGPYDSVLGRDVRAVLGRFLDGLPRRFEVATGDVRISGALIEIDPVSRRATSIQLVTVRADEPAGPVAG
jgi:2',3'-cyclic-nucleotide 2'-phosphodiesterase